MGQAQQERDYAAELAQLEAELDSLSIFSLLDSVINLDYRIPSELILRTGYTSNMVNAGRNYGIDQYGFSTGISYYHQKGFYTDLSSYWNSDYDPMYTVSMMSIGYLNSFKRKISYSVNYERWMYNNKLSDLSNGFKNNFGGFLSYELGPLYLGLDYSYLFNESKSSNRLIGSLSSSFSIKKVWLFDKINFLPNANLVYGNDDVTIYYQGSLVDGFRSEQLLNSELDRRQLDEFLRSVTLTPMEQMMIDQIQNNNQISRQEKRRRTMNVLLNNIEVQTYLYEQLDQVTNQYGIMSYSFSLPVTFQINKWRWMCAYTYSIPVSLPGEDYDLDPISYFTTSLSYRFSISSGSR